MNRVRAIRHIIYFSDQTGIAGLTTLILRRLLVLLVVRCLRISLIQVHAGRIKLLLGNNLPVLPNIRPHVIALHNLPTARHCSTTPLSLLTLLHNSRALIPPPTTTTTTIPAHSLIKSVPIPL